MLNSMRSTLVRLRTPVIVRYLPRTDFTLVSARSSKYLPVIIDANRSRVSMPPLSASRISFFACRLISAVLAPAVVLGIVIGQRAFQRIDPEMVRHVALVVLALLAVGAIARVLVS